MNFLFSFPLTLLLHISSLLPYNILSYFVLPSTICNSLYSLKRERSLFFCIHYSVPRKVKLYHRTARPLRKTSTASTPAKIQIDCVTVGRLSYPKSCIP